MLTGLLHWRKCQLVGTSKYPLSGQHGAGLQVSCITPPLSSGSLATTFSDVISVQRCLEPWLDGIQELLETIASYNAQWTKVSCHDIRYQL